MALVAAGVGYTYQSLSGGEVKALEGIDLKIDTGEFVTIIGPSGCGKSTLLHCLGGLLRPKEGTITIDGEPVLEPDPRKAAFVFQDYTLLPWKNALENAAIGLQFDRWKRAEREAQARELLNLVGLSDFERALPGELSGGMQQRVAIARALCMNPRTMLMDEPFGALDEQTRRQLGFEMARILTENNSTVVLVTHSLDEAILWADRIVVLSPRPGRIAREIQVGEERPRGVEFSRTDKFAAIRSELLSLLDGAGTAANHAGAH